MPSDPSIFQQYLQAPKTVLDYQNQYNEADAKKNALAMSVQALQKGQMDLSNAADVSRQRNALRAAITSGQIDLSNPDHAPKALALAPDIAPAMLKTVQEGATSRAVAAKDTADAGKTTQETQIAGHAQHLQSLSTVNDPQSAVQWITDGVRSGALPAAGLQPALDRLQQAAATPEGFAQWKQQTQAMGLTVQQQMEQTTPKPTEVRLGNVVKTIDMNPRSASFGKEVVGQQAIGVSPDTEANNATSIRTTGMNNATSIRTTGMNNATSTANNRATIAKDYNVAGLNPDGTPGTANDSMVDAIGQYKVAPPNGMALRNPRMQQILADVTAKYPDFDATQYGARQGAAKSFSTGKDGQAVQSANTALNHLGTLRELAAAQDNGNIRLFNTIANRFATETGGAAPSNLAAAVTMVGPEISKAVIGVGGGQGDREKVDAALSALTKGGKGQAAGTLATMEDLFGGRLTEAQRTYERTTGRKDFPATFLSPAAQRVLAARGAPAAAPGAPAAAPPGWTYIGPVK